MEPLISAGLVYAIIIIFHIAKAVRSANMASTAKKVGIAVKRIVQNLRSG